MAGVVPYLATSLNTAYLAWEINNAATKGSTFLISGQSAELMLHMIEPIQVGYGAVVSAARKPSDMNDAKHYISDPVLPRCYSLGS